MNAGIERVRQYAIRNNVPGYTRNSMARASTSRTTAREIIQGVVDSTQGEPPVERASTAVEEMAADDHSATTFSAQAPITATQIQTTLWG